LLAGATRAPKVGITHRVFARLRHRRVYLGLTL